MDPSQAEAFRSWGELLAAKCDDQHLVLVNIGSMAWGVT